MSIVFLFTFIFLFNLLIFIKFSTISKNFIFFDKPDGKLKRHKYPISLIGGLVILINLYLIIFFLKILNLNEFIFENKFIYFLVILGTFFYLIGLVDDLKNLTPNIKLFWIFLVLTTVLYIFPEIRLNQIKISFLKSYIQFEYSYFFLIFCFALLVNAMNMFDGINLQVILLTILIFLILIIKGFVVIFFSLLLIPVLFLAILNYQNKVFLGDGGSYLLSAIIGSVFIYQYNNFENFLYGDEIFIILLIPAIDMLRLFFVRIINKKNPFRGDLNHLHHLVNLHTNNSTKTVLINLILFTLPSVLLLSNLKTYNILFICVFLYFITIIFLRFKTK